MTPRRAACFIALVWVCSSLISFPAIAWWRAVAVDAVHQQSPPTPPVQCEFTDDIGYLVFSSTVSFYGPLSVMVFTYCRIYRAAVAQSRSLRLGMKQVVTSCGDLGGPAEAVELTLRIHRGGRAASDSRRCAATLLTYQTTRRPLAGASSTSSLEPATGGDAGDQGIATLSGSSVDVNAVGARVPMCKMNFSLSRKLAKIAKERKAAKSVFLHVLFRVHLWLSVHVAKLEKNRVA